jgi:hypothetical protein
MYYHPENTKLFRIRTMPRNRVQDQKGLSDDAFEQRYSDEEACSNVGYLMQGRRSGFSSALAPQWPLGATDSDDP